MSGRYGVVVEVESAVPVVAGRYAERLASLLGSKNTVIVDASRTLPGVFVDWVAYGIHREAARVETVLLFHAAAAFTAFYASLYATSHASRDDILRGILIGDTVIALNYKYAFVRLLGGRIPGRVQERLHETILDYYAPTPHILVYVEDPGREDDIDYAVQSKTLYGDRDTRMKVEREFKRLLEELEANPEYCPGKTAPGWTVKLAEFIREYTRLDVSIDDLYPPGRCYPLTLVVGEGEYERVVELARSIQSSTR